MNLPWTQVCPWYKYPMRRVLSVCLVLSALISSTGVLAEALAGRMVRVIDGDTVVVLGPGNAQHRIRLSGIDAPERGKPYGRASGRHLSENVAGKHVVVDWNKRDRYGRIVGKVLLSGQDVNLEQVSVGMAWHYKRYASEQSPSDQTAYSEAETGARLTRSGLWAEPEPAPPWEWRRGRR